MRTTLTYGAYTSVLQLWLHDLETCLIQRLKCNTALRALKIGPKPLKLLSEGFDVSVYNWFKLELSYAAHTVVANSFKSGLR